MKLTSATIPKLNYTKQHNAADLYFDSTLKGFGIRVYPSGRKAFFVSYRNHVGTKKRFTLGDHETLTFAEARKLAREKLADVLKGRDPSAENRQRLDELTYAELCERYLEAAKDYKRSIKDDRQRLRDHIFPKLRTKKLSEISLHQLQQLHREIKQRTSASTANRCAALIKKIFNDAVRWELMSQSPARHLKLFKEPSPRETYLSPDECRRFIEACNSDENIFACGLFLLAMFTGRRIGELLNAEWSDLDQQNQTLTIHQTKSGERQQVVLDTVALEVFASIPQLLGNPFIIAGKKAGCRMNHYRRAWDRIIKRSGLKNFPPHGLRHNYASMLVARNVPLSTVQKLVGHKSALTTSKYAHHRNDELRRAAGEFSNVIALTKRKTANST